MDMNDFLTQRISTLTEEEINKIFHGQFPSELTQEDRKRKEDLYLSRLAKEVDIDHVKIYSHSEA